MGREKLESAIETLKGQYFSLSWVYQDVTANHKQEKMLRWPGPPEDDILIVVHQCGGEQEPFHHHDFFYFNFTYKGEYDLSLIHISGCRSGRGCVRPRGWGIPPAPKTRTFDKSGWSGHSRHTGPSAPS